MKHSILTVFTAMSLVAAGQTFAATEATHDHGDAHAHDGAAAVLQLNAGSKWETDAPLRKAIGDIRQSMAASLEAIHKSRLPAKGYRGLAHKIEGAVGDIVANCKLEPKADAQLHIIVADLLAGAEQMAGKSKKAKPMDGAVKVILALNNYGEYFNDPGFKPIAH
ncbi:MAG: hypothetical protein K9J42_15210 [Sulfuritalea sp.]|nr:hypothetical protein [Sulfuritalea sp.]